MNKLYSVAVASLVLLIGTALPTEGQTFLMNSAETINQGNFKVAGYPVVLLGEGDADNTWGMGARFGYGFTSRFDVEATVGLFDGLTLYGANAELWLLQGPLDVSATVGGHLADYDGISSKALDLAGMASGHVTRNLELIVGLSASLESFDDVDQDFTRLHLVPGVEYRVAQDLDLVAEFGYGLNDDSGNYAAIGLAYYLR